MVTFVLTLFVFLQVLRGGLDQMFETAGIGQNLGLPRLHPPAGKQPALVESVARGVPCDSWPCGPCPRDGRYFLVSRDRTGRGSGLHPLTGALDRAGRERRRRHHLSRRQPSRTACGVRQRLPC